MNKIGRNQVAVVLAVLAAFVLVASPVMALFAVWTGDLRWLYTSGIVLVLAAALYYIGTVMFDDGRPGGCRRPTGARCPGGKGFAPRPATAACSRSAPERGQLGVMKGDACATTRGPPRRRSPRG